MKESMSCVDNHMKHCFTPTQRKVFNHVVAGARQVLLELCVPGVIQEGEFEKDYIYIYYKFSPIKYAFYLN